MEDFNRMCAMLRQSSIALTSMTSKQKMKALSFVCKAVKDRERDILDANMQDVEDAKAHGMKESMIDRLKIDSKKIDGMCKGVIDVASLKEVIGEEVIGWKTADGLEIRRVRYPLGVVSIIYESRPNVTLDAFALCYKSANAVLLRGSSNAYRTNKEIVAAVKAGLIAAGKDGEAGAVELLESKRGDYSDVDAVLNAVGLIDVVVPRGGKSLISRVVSNAHVPCIETGSGVCHLYVDDTADIAMAAKVAKNAKMSRPSVCNAIECILVHKSRLLDFIPALIEAFGNKVELRADDECYKAIEEYDKDKCALYSHAVPSDWDTEFLDFICAIHAVSSIDEAIDFINRHGTGHSECIITENRASAREFQRKTDAACVYVNASTRFTDGGEFGFGAELGISTQKLHARGPMGIEALTTVKYLIDGDGQVRE